MSNPSPEKVSVVIPLYNAQPYIANTIGSVLEQTFSDIKIYVIDDHSTDASPKKVQEIAEKYPHKVMYHRADKKGGCPAATKNVGIRLTKGEYIAFIDHDDWWEPKKLEKQVAYLDAHPDVNLLGTNVAVVDTDRNKTLGNFWTNPNELKDANLRRLALEGPIFASTTCMIGRASFLKNHLFDATYIGADEYDMSLHALLDDEKQVAILPQVLAYWRWHEQSLSHSTQAAERSAKDEEHFAHKLLKRTDLTEEERAIVLDRLWMVRRRLANTLLTEGKRKEARELYQKVIRESHSPERLVRTILVLDSLLPPLAQWLVKFKKQLSYARPTFR